MGKNGHHAAGHDVEVVVLARESERGRPARSPSAQPETKETDTADLSWLEAKETQTDVAAAAAAAAQKQEERRERRGRRERRSRPRETSDTDSGSDSGSDSDDDCLCLQPWGGPLYSPSASYRQVDVVSGSHQYTISGFSMARSMGCGTRLCSDFFEVCGQLFRIEVYPGGFTADARKYVSVFVTTPGSANPNHVLYEVAVLDQSGRDRHIVERRGNGAHEQRGGRRHGGGGFGYGYGGGAACCMYGPMLSHGRGIVAALPKFVRASTLEARPRRYLLCDMLALRVTVQVLQGWSSQPTVHYHGSYAPHGRATAGGYGAAPGGHGAAPGGYGAALGGYGAALGGMAPGGYGMAPGGYGMAPGGGAHLGLAAAPFPSAYPMPMPGFAHAGATTPRPGWPGAPHSAAATAAGPPRTSFASVGQSMPGSMNSAAAAAAAAAHGTPQPVAGAQPPPGAPSYAPQAPHPGYTGAVHSPGLSAPPHYASPLPPQYLMNMNSPNS